jgi:hypothetical protein
MHGPLQGPTGQEVDIGTLELPGTRAAEYESHATFFHESVNLVQEARKALYLIHHYPARGIDGSQFALKQARICKEGLIGSL